MPLLDRSVIAVAGLETIGSGSVRDLLPALVAAASDPARGQVLIFDAVTSERVELDLRGTPTEVAARLAESMPAPRPPGRPRLGVVAREVTLLPRHWDWLSQQRGGASAVLRRLVDTASRDESRGAIVGRARDRCYRFMSQVAGDLPLFEAATRALYAGDARSFAAATEAWPAGIRDHVTRLASEAFPHHEV